MLRSFFSWDGSFVANAPVPVTHRSMVWILGKEYFGHVNFA